MNDDKYSFGNLKNLNLRDIWKDEARDFTPWLATNLDFLSEELGIELELIDTEAGVGSFSLDVLAKDLSTNKNVVIENQLTPTDHDHLGKLITYSSGYDSEIAIWIASSFRDEHRQALDWLNHRTDVNTQFFGLVPKVFRIDDSKPVIQFNLVVYPNDWQKTDGNTDVSEKSKKYKSYFQKLIDRLREDHKFTNAKKGQYQSWYSFSSGTSGVYYGANFTITKKVRTEIYMGAADKEYNKSIFDQLYDEKDVIEAELGEKLNWDRLDDKNACRISLCRDGVIDSEQSVLDEFLDWQTESLLKFKEVFHERINQISLG